MATCYAVETAVVGYDSTAGLGDVVLEVNEVLALLVRDDVVKVDVLVAPLEVMDYPLVRQLLLHNEDVLEKVNDALLDVEVVELRNHCFLVFQIPFVLVDQSVSFINYVSDVVENCTIGTQIQLRKLLMKTLIFFFFSLKLGIHIFDLDIVSF